MDAIGILLATAAALLLFGPTILDICVWLYSLRRDRDEHDISGVGALDAARLRGADLSHGAATVQRRGGV